MKWLSLALVLAIGVAGAIWIGRARIARPWSPNVADLPGAAAAAYPDSTEARTAVTSRGTLAVPITLVNDATAASTTIDGLLRDGQFMPALVSTRNRLLSLSTYEIDGPMFDAEATPMAFSRSSTLRMSLSGSLALRQAHTKASPLRAGRMSSAV